MRNNWKIAFWTLLTVFVTTTLYLGYVIIDLGTTITYMKEGYEDTENDLLQLSSSLKGKLTKSDFSEILKRYPDSTELKTIDLNRIRIKFDKYNKVDTITTNW
jgi:hypothetical protein